MKNVNEMTKNELKQEVIKLRKKIAHEKRCYKAMLKNMIDWVLSIKNQQQIDTENKELMSFWK